MKRLVFILLFAVSAFAAEQSNPFDSPVTGFSDALLPILTSFEKAVIKKTLRGFNARGDSAPGFSHSETEPSEDGLFLYVAVNEDVKQFSDRTEQKNGIAHRTVQILAPKQGEQSLVIELHYGPHVSSSVIGAIDTCIKRITEFAKKSRTR